MPNVNYFISCSEFITFVFDRKDIVYDIKSNVKCILLLNYFPSFVLLKTYNKILCPDLRFPLTIVLQLESGDRIYERFSDSESFVSLTK